MPPEPHVVEFSLGAERWRLAPRPRGTDPEAVPPRSAERVLKHAFSNPARRSTLTRLLSTYGTTGPIARADPSVIFQKLLARIRSGALTLTRVSARPGDHDPRHPRPPQRVAPSARPFRSPQPLDWISIELCTLEDGTHDGVRVELWLPEETSRILTLRDGAPLRFDSIRPGLCTIQFPEILRRTSEGEPPAHGPPTPPDGILLGPGRSRHSLATGEAHRFWLPGWEPHGLRIAPHPVDPIEATPPTGGDEEASDAGWDPLPIEIARV